MGYTQDVINHVSEKYKNQTEFIQAVNEVFKSIEKFVDNEPKYSQYSVLERLVIPDRILYFRVAWMDDNGFVKVNNGCRVQYNSAIGIYKGGLRFHPSVNLSILKFLGFEQTFKNALTGLDLGGAKGGSDFDPKGKSTNEIMKFCHAFMNELYKYIGPDIDVPAGDIGVSSREIGYLFGRYRKLTNRFNGVLTGKGISYGGSTARTEATGYGCVYFAREMLEARGESLEGKVCSVSGSGNVALYAIEKLIQMGAKPVSASDSNGFIYDKNGIDIELLKDIKLNQNERISKYAEIKKCEYIDKKNGDKSIWDIPCFGAFPCATQNELNENDAKTLLANGAKLVSEGANMPSTLEAIKLFLDAKISFGPSKAANAGGVGVSGLEMSQNARFQKDDFHEIDIELQKIMKNIFVHSSEEAKFYKDPTNLVFGSNVFSFKKVASAMIEQGVF